MPQLIARLAEHYERRRLARPANEGRMMRMHPAVLIALGIVAAGGAAAAAPVAALLTTRAGREAYLAHATIWRDRGPLSPDDVRRGPTDAFPGLAAGADTAVDLTCSFAAAGRTLGGNSPKFLCRSSGGQLLRVKYWDRELDTGTREVFAAVAATRLLWALGFGAVPVLPVNVRCDDCPADPMTGDGPIAPRQFVGVVQNLPHGPLIISSHNLEQGWSWRELDEAVNTLPAGAERLRQRSRLDALALLAVVMAHGDRKPEQQALFCDTAIGPAAGATILLGNRTALTEGPGAAACATADATIVDVGATFGGAGRLSRESTAKMNLRAWEAQPVFLPVDGPTCRGNLRVSLAAGADGEPDPVISEEGRRFLLEQIHRLSAGHVRALFAAARVDQLAGGRHARALDADGDRLDGWVAAFFDKVRQIETKTCAPANR